MKKRLCKLLKAKWTRCASLLALFGWCTGFVPARFAHWMNGAVAEIHRQPGTMVIQDNASKQVFTFHWNQETRLWRAPVNREDNGKIFDPNQIKNGDSVQVMFKKYSDHCVIYRVILQPSKAGSHHAIPGAITAPGAPAFPATFKTK